MIAPARPRRHDTDTAGFTLPELLVAMGLSAVIAVGLYSISLVAAQTFQQQQRISEMQLRLRNATETVRLDVQRAGYMATPSSAKDPLVCPRPANVVQGVVVNVPSANPTILASSNSFIVPKQLLLTGNYASSDDYLIAAINDKAVTLQSRTQQYARIRDANAFSRIFCAGCLVRLLGTNGQMQFNTVSSVTYQSVGNATAPLITLVNSVAITGTGGSACGISGIGVGGTIAPLRTIEYGIGNFASTLPLAYPPAATGAGQPDERTAKTDLRRHELPTLQSTTAPIDGTEQLVAEYAVDFDVAAVLDDAVTGAVRPTLVHYGFGNSNVASSLGLAGSAGARPERTRALAIRLSVRDRLQDRDFAWVARASTDPLTRFRVFDTLLGAARVRTATFEVEVPNIAFRALRN